MSTSTIKNYLPAELTETKDIISDASNVSNIQFFIGSGATYTGNLPDYTYQYGLFLVFKRRNDIDVFGFYGGRGIILNVYSSSQQAWAGWKELT